MIKKLSRQREENSQLVNQNHKLMTELENLSYDLHQARNKVLNILSDLHKESTCTSSVRTIYFYAVAIRFTMLLCFRCNDHLNMGFSNHCNLLCWTFTIGENSWPRIGSWKKKTSSNGRQDSESGVRLSIARGCCEVYWCQLLRAWQMYIIILTQESWQVHVCIDRLMSSAKDYVQMWQLHFTHIASCTLSLEVNSRNCDKFITDKLRTTCVQYYMLQWLCSN